jgi:hypothetical protein
MALKMQFILFTEFLSTSTGPVMTKFTIALREIGTYKEVLRSQVKIKILNNFLSFQNLEFLDLVALS